MAEPTRISQLLEKYTADTLTKEELAELLAYFDIDSNEADAQQHLFNLLARQADSKIDAKRMASVMDAAFMRLNNRINTPKKNKLLRLMPYAAAILLLFVAGISYYTLTNKSETAHREVVIDVNPGTSGATLTLANGKKIRLSTAAGNVLNEAGISINNAPGELVYKNTENSKVAAGQLNTLSTGNGETYNIVLVDGTKVWLNAGSALTYNPNLMESGERVVKVAGEAYFEVAKDKMHPFIVNSNGQKIEVLGTHFNVNTYEGDRNTITTLAEGSVKISTDRKANFLKPGQQSITANGTINIQPADLETELAWKDGKMYFKDAALPKVMTEIARWYNVQIKYVGKPARALFNGGFSRMAKLSEVLQILNASNVQCKLIAENNITTIVVNTNKPNKP